MVTPWSQNFLFIYCLIKGLCIVGEVGDQKTILGSLLEADRTSFWSISAKKNHSDIRFLVLVYLVVFVVAVAAAVVADVVAVACQEMLRKTLWKLLRDLLVRKESSNCWNC